jgi:hypothetical protein
MMLAPDRVAGLVLSGDPTEPSRLASVTGVDVLDSFLRRILGCPFIIVWDGDSSSGVPGSVPWRQKRKVVKRIRKVVKRIRKVVKRIRKLGTRTPMFLRIYLQMRRRVRYVVGAGSDYQRTKEAHFDSNGFQNNNIHSEE